MTSSRLLPAAAVLLACASALALVATAGGAAPRPKPNLTVSRSVVPLHMELGARKTVRVTVKNAGRATAAASTLKLTFSSSSRPGRTLFGTGRVGSLAPGASQVVPVTATVPRSAPMGVTNVVACADSAARVVETSERDNCKAVSTHVM